MYINFCKEKYKVCTIVFDGYEGGSSIKDNTHRRRTGGQKGTEIRIETDMIMHSKKQQVLLNRKNKQKFINMLSEAMLKTEIHVIQAKSDADYLNVRTAVDSAESTFFCRS